MTKNDLKFFRPLWRRLVVVAICMFWTAWELSNGETMWAVLSAVLALYCVWELFIRFQPVDENEKSETDTQD